MFFLRRTQPLALGGGQLRGLRLSLNTPVVATADLPVGPARAAILVHAEPRRGLALTIAVRSLGCGSLALYAFEGAVAPAQVAEVVDAALSFAESMGFLFDDELVASDAASREKALGRWREAIGDGESSLPPIDAEAAAEPEAPLELFDLAGSDLTDPPVAPEPLPASGEIDLPEELIELGPESELEAEPLAFPPGSETLPGPPLTKFRVSADTERSGEPAQPMRAPRKQPLGRLRLERRRQVPPVQDARRGWLLRLLTSF